MTVAGLPGIPGGSVLVPAIDSFTAQVFTGPDIKHHEICGAFIYRHLEPHIADGEIQWAGEIDWVQLENVAEDPSRGFEIRNAELKAICEQELESLRVICENHGGGDSVNGRSAADLYRSGFSPFVGTAHSHPGGSKLPSAADYRLAEAATQWRRAAAPATLMGLEAEAKFFEADFLFAVHDLLEGHGTLVHFKKGLVRGEWEGNFRPRVD